MVFSIAFDSATVEATVYFDVRVKFEHKNKIVDAHLLALPLEESHTGDNMFNVFSKATLPFVLIRKESLLESHWMVLPT